MSRHKRLIVDGNVLIQKGIYGIKDLGTNEIVYVGSATKSFGFRWGTHIYEAIQGIHCNKELSDLILSGNFEFIILDANDYSDSECLEKERLYSKKYETSKYGYGKRVGGGSFINTNNRNLRPFERTEPIIKAYSFIKRFIGRKIDITERDIIVNELNKLNIKTNTTNFVNTIKRIGFKVNRFKSKHEWLIEEEL